MYKIVVVRCGHYIAQIRILINTYSVKKFELDHMIFDA
jgi:hypothetical protein